MQVASIQPHARTRARQVLNADKRMGREGSPKLVSPQPGAGEPTFCEKILLALIYTENCQGKFSKNFQNPIVGNGLRPGPALP
jgi:hypothetical protein